jgi:hypothetical protein
MSNPLWRRCLRSLAFTGGVAPRRSPRRGRAYARPLANARLEELESRLAPASFAINSQLQISSLSEPEASATETHAVVFFESSVANYQILRQGVSTATDSVVLDSTGDGLREMAAFLAGRHNLTSIGVVAHGAPGAVSLGTGTLNLRSLGGYTPELAAVGSALGRGGELDLWSCDVAAGQAGVSLVRDLAVATDAGVAAASHTVGSAALGGNWQLDVRVAGAWGEVPFAADALGAFHELLGTWSAAASMASARDYHQATLLTNGMVLVTGGSPTNYFRDTLPSAELYNPVSNSWSSAGSMATGRINDTVTQLSNGQVLVTGGIDSTGAPQSSAELYDPVSNRWSAAASMTTAREWHTATLLTNGMVLVTGGSRSLTTLAFTCPVRSCTTRSVTPGLPLVPWRTGILNTRRRC